MNKNELIFGAAYYNEYMPYDRIEKDLTLMKEAGMNTIRIAESTWSTEEPHDGVFNFKPVTDVLDVAEKLGMNVIIGTPTYAVPAWLVKKYPDIMVTNRNGQVKYGPRQSMDILNPDFLRYAERIIRKLAEAVQPYKCVIGFQLDNETKHYDNYGKYAQKKFLDHLKTKYKTTDEFNKAFTLAYWSNSIHDWDDMPDISNSINWNLHCEYEHFLRTCVAEYLNWQAKIIREYKRPDQFITHNFDFGWIGYSYGEQPGINHAQASSAVTIAGCDIYHPSQDELTGAEIAFGGDKIRTLKNQNYIILETEAQGFKEWTPYPKQLRLQAFSHLASGANGHMYWNWHSIHNSMETYWKGVLGHELQPGVIYNYAKQIGEEYKKYGHQLINLKKKNEVAIVTDTDSLTALKFYPMDYPTGGLSYNDVLRWTYDALYKMNVECDVVDINALNPSDYKMIVTPALYCISNDNTTKLYNFVAEGGVLFSSFRSFYADTKGSVYDAPHPYKLTDVFGMEYSMITQAGNAKVLNQPVEVYAELIENKDAQILASYEHKYWSQYAAVTKNKFRNGCAYYFAAKTSQEVLSQILKDALSEAKITVPPVQFPLIIRSGDNSKGRKVHYIFNYSSEDYIVQNPFGDCVNLLTEKPYFHNDKIEISDWDFIILMEQ
ncbi:MAG: beta-galactosidase [Treponema sp.]|nr:beta-galactosidase [Treponema sp.]